MTLLFLALLFTDLRSRVRGELSAEEIADPGPQVTLPVVILLDRGLLFDLFLRAVMTGAESVHVAQLLEKHDRIVDLVEPELEGLDVARVEMHRNFVAG